MVDIWSIGESMDNLWMWLIIPSGNDYKFAAENCPFIVDLPTTNDDFP